MVGALHADGLQVVLDQVFNHTTASGQAPQSVLDRVVPGYYQRLNATGNVETSTCCQNVATEHAMAQKAMVDSVVTWARDYKVDGFRFDLMGHHSVENMEAIRTALDKLTPKKDGVDGSKVYLYGEGWNFGEVANNALFTQATQGQLGGTGIGTFSDRLRDAVRGGGPFDENPRIQGFGSGGGTDPNGDAINGSTADQLARAAHDADLVRLGMAGNLRDYAFETSAGTVQKGAEILYNGQPAGYADSPEEVITYVDAHDNETLWDSLTYKLPVGHPDGGPRAHEHRLAGDDGPGPDPVVLARGRRPAAQQVARPQQLQLGRLVQPARPVRPGQRLRPRSAAGGRQRGQVAVPAAAAGRPGAQADRRRTSPRRRRRPTTC